MGATIDRRISELEGEWNIEPPSTNGHGMSDAELRATLSPEEQARVDSIMAEIEAGFSAYDRFLKWLDDSPPASIGHGLSTRWARAMYGDQHSNGLMLLHEFVTETGSQLSPLADRVLQNEVVGGGLLALRQIADESLLEQEAI